MVKNKGCEFVFDKCVNSSHQINPKFENEYFDVISTNTGIEPSCSSGRHSRSYHALYEIEDIPPDYQYFSNSNIGGWSPADYCPVSQTLHLEENNAYFPGHCSTRGSGIYGTNIPYVNPNINSTSENMLGITGEIYSDNSFCFLSSLVKNTILI